MLIMLICISKRGVIIILVDNKVQIHGQGHDHSTCTEWFYKKRKTLGSNELTIIIFVFMSVFIYESDCLYTRISGGCSGRF